MVVKSEQQCPQLYPDQISDNRSLCLHTHPHTRARARAPKTQNKSSFTVYYHDKKLKKESDERNCCPVSGLRAGRFYVCEFGVKKFYYFWNIRIVF